MLKYNTTESFEFPAPNSKQKYSIEFTLHSDAEALVNEARFERNLNEYERNYIDEQYKRGGLRTFWANESTYYVVFPKQDDNSTKYYLP